MARRTLRLTLMQTPRRLVFAGVATGLLTIAFATVLGMGASAARGGLATMASEAGEVDATNDLYFRLNDMDAQAANALLVGFHGTLAVPAAVNAQSADDTYQTDRAAADQDLQKIAVNPALADQYTRLLNALGGYEALIGQALYIDQGAVAQAPAVPPATALSAYQQASSLMHSSVLPIASQITTTDSTRVDGQYTSDRSGARTYAVLSLLTGLLVLAGLAAASLFLARRFRRMLSPALAAAALVTLVATAAGTTALWHAAGQFKIAKQDAFDSINALTRARAVSYDANADESRWLLDRTDTLQSSFFAKASQVAAVPGVDAAAVAADRSSYYSGLHGAVAQLQVDSGANSVAHVKIGGFLGTELDNITFPGEALGAATTARDFDSYLQGDAVIRADADRGDLAAAVAFDVGTQSGQSNYAYSQYDQALAGVITINENAFQSAITDGRSALAVWTWLAFAAGAASLLLIGTALYPRLREYR